MNASIRLILASLLVAALAASCTAGGGSGSPAPAPPTAGPGDSSTTSGPSGSSGGAFPSGECVPGASPCASPVPSTVQTGAGAASPTPLAGFACPLAATTLPLPSNRLTEVVVTPRDGYDEVAFVLGTSGPGGGLPAQVTVAPATPPFVAGASGQPLAVEGQTFVTLTFREMVVADDAGTPTYAGPAVIRPATSGVQEVVQSEAFEGVVGWIVGSRAPGCSRVHADPAGSRILLDVQRG
jgi:hypothetical protein